MKMSQMAYDMVDGILVNIQLILGEKQTSNYFAVVFTATFFFT